MEVSLGWQPCTCCSLLICARFCKAAPRMPLAWYRNCNYCSLAEMPSITTKLFCIQIEKSVSVLDFEIWIPYFPLCCFHGQINPFRDASGDGHCEMSGGRRVSIAPCAACVHGSLRATSRHDTLLVGKAWLNLQKSTSPPAMGINWPQVRAAPILDGENFMKNTDIWHMCKM